MVGSRGGQRVTIKGGGVSIGADYITVRDCVVHDMPGVGISANSPDINN